MAATLLKLNNVAVNCKNLSQIGLILVRHGHHLRGKPPGVARTLQQRLDELNYKDPELHFRVDIGLPQVTQSPKDNLKQRLETIKVNRKNIELEQKARHNKLLIDIEQTQSDWIATTGPNHIKKIADHYGVFQHLFGDAYFIPRVSLNIIYNHEDLDIPVYFGNIIKPREATSQPTITYQSDESSLWTIILTNPDGHLTKPNSEYVHWFIGNIPGNNIEKGEKIVEYLSPFPPKGTGYHRHIFVLYKQNKKLDFSKFKVDGINLEGRTFSTLDFYKDLQDEITPAGLSFFQSDWDKSVTQLYHHKFNMKEPHFEYDFPPPYLRRQEWFPLRKPFNLYMDKYRDPKQIHKEFLVRKLKNVHPFKPDPQPLPYPNAKYFEGYIPSWLKLEKTKSRLRWGRVNDIE